MDLNTKVKYLSEVSLFEDMSEQELIDLADISRVKNYKKHQIIYRVDDPAEDVYILVNGVVKIISKSVDGREVIKTIIHPKSLFGTEYISGQGMRYNTAKSVDKDVRCLHISSD
jgi:CRP/FNR family transcriptional regulator